ncbi:MAG: aldo/keto reductase, partial [Nitriliruptoraceae bacterium]
MQRDHDIHLGGHRLQGRDDPGRHLGIVDVGGAVQGGDHHPVGQAVRGRRSRIVIATKFGNQFDEATKQITGSSARPDYIRSACEASLQRLNTDYIDLYQFHLNDFPPAGVDDVLDTLERLVAAGKIRSYGWSTD